MDWNKDPKDHPERISSRHGITNIHHDDNSGGPHGGFTLNDDRSRITFTAVEPEVITCLLFYRDRVIVASIHHLIHIYSSITGQLLETLEGHTSGVWALELVGDILVSGSTDQTVRTWNLVNSWERHVFHGHTGTVRCIQIVEPIMSVENVFEPPEPLIISGSRDASLRVWRLPREQDLEVPSRMAS
jgi:F-box and WD-40 domain protein CDC4